MLGQAGKKFEPRRQVRKRNARKSGNQHGQTLE
jgi:hypothetical protein